MIDYKKRYEELVDAMGYQVDVFDDEQKHQTLIKAAQALLRVKTAMLTSSPENSGALFITGVSGAKDKMGLPEYVSVCPKYGLDGSAFYKKVSDYNSPGY